MARDPADRFTDAAAMLAALTVSDPASSTEAIGPPPVTLEPTQLLPSGYRPHGRRRRWVAMVAALLLAAGLLAWFAVGADSSDSPRAVTMPTTTVAPAVSTPTTIDGVIAAMQADPAAYGQHTDEIVNELVLIEQGDAPAERAARSSTRSPVDRQRRSHPCRPGTARADPAAADQPLSPTAPTTARRTAATAMVAATGMAAATAVARTADIQPHQVFIASTVSYRLRRAPRRPRAPPDRTRQSRNRSPTVDPGSHASPSKPRPMREHVRCMLCTGNAVGSRRRAGGRRRLAHGAPVCRRLAGRLRQLQPDVAPCAIPELDEHAQAGSTSVPTQVGWAEEPVSSGR